jgi:HlyD family secretion protein
MLVPNGALRFEPEKEDAAGGVSSATTTSASSARRSAATIGRGSRQTVYVLKDDGTLDEIEVVTGQSDGATPSVTSRELKRA